MEEQVFIIYLFRRIEIFFYSPRVKTNFQTYQRTLFLLIARNWKTDFYYLSISPILVYTACDRI